MFDNFFSFISNFLDTEKFKLKKIKENVRSLYSTQIIPAETRIIKVPLNYIITYKKALNESPLLKKVFNNLNINRIQHIILSLYLIQYMENSEHKFKPYFDILPKDLTNMPIFWSDNYLKNLQGSPFLEMIEKRNTLFTEEFSKITDILTDLELNLLFNNYSDNKLNRYKFARSLVSSRNFSINVNLEPINALVPLADMLNHKIPSKTTWGFENDHFFIDTTEIIPRNSEINDSYGHKSNYSYLLFYGFTIFSKNSLLTNLDSVDISLKSLNIQLTLPFSKHVLKQLLYDVEIQNLENISKHKIIKHLYNLNKNLIGLLDKYPTTYKEDIKLLESKLLSEFSNKYNALVIVSGEKFVLQTYIEKIFEIIDEVLDKKKTNYLSDIF